MNWPKLVVLVRHGESIGNRADETNSFDDIIRSGISMDDLPLTERGEEQARITREYLHKNYRPFDVYLRSPLIRAQETAQLLYPDVPFQINPLLAEVDEGIWHLMTEEEIKQRYPEEIKMKQKKGFYKHTPLWGKSCQDVENTMVRPFVTELLLFYSGKNILIVGHGKWFGIFDGFIQGLPIPQREANIEKGLFDNASITRYERKSDKLTLGEKNIIPWKGLI
ncbi:histidine phosphatase family protein [Patescibacteria group bacterium AH-259-L07]|nr:histidine phosphatase family protein [Patescibacteria group bacterium AH-259-L07]